MPKLVLAELVRIVTNRPPRSERCAAGSSSGAAARIRQVYDWSAAERGLPGVRDLLTDGSPYYAWPADDRRPWFPRPGVLARAGRRALPPP
ncbi:hypothetical protein GCM10010472_50840 [Pseudonocardia halophobica]|uniref:Uncharacterized protein n=1 Tax=Pseudonocardia halophobica TaxID=29401 RepID=A0A9W6L064_9PSEU|nr:hypothetical protein GCM10017577_23620 [Pseudonocardia halophobica]